MNFQWYTMYELSVVYKGFNFLVSLYSIHQSLLLRRTYVFIHVLNLNYQSGLLGFGDTFNTDLEKYLHTPLSPWSKPCRSHRAASTPKAAVAVALRYREREQLRCRAPRGEGRQQRALPPCAERREGAAPPCAVAVAAASLVAPLSSSRDKAEGDEWMGIPYRFDWIGVVRWHFSVISTKGDGWRCNYFQSGAVEPRFGRSTSLVQNAGAIHPTPLQVLVNLNRLAQLQLQVSWSWELKLCQTGP